MAIDTKSVSQLITDFRALKAKDSITPESLGYILQRLADLLATAGNSETIAKIQALLDGFRIAGYAITNIKQGAADRNNVNAVIDSSTSAQAMSLRPLASFCNRLLPNVPAQCERNSNGLEHARTGVASLQSR